MKKAPKFLPVPAWLKKNRFWDTLGQFVHNRLWEFHEIFGLWYQKFKGAQQRRKLSFSPVLESLEKREVMTTYTLNTPDPLDGTGDITSIQALDASAEAFGLGNLSQSSPFSAAFWVKRTALSSVVGFAPTEVDGGWGIAISDPNAASPSLGIIDLTKTGYSHVDSSGGITDTDWHHVVVTFANYTTTFYIDGSLDNQVAYNVDFGTAASYTLSGAAYFDDVRFYTAELNSSAQMGKRNV
jgi:hypothetical protein